jgi:hypothetical protein
MSAIYIRYDTRYDLYGRKIYSVLDLLGDIGGLYQSMFSIGLILIQFLAERMFVSSILKQIY